MLISTYKYTYTVGVYLIFALYSKEVGAWEEEEEEKEIDILGSPQCNATKKDNERERENTDIDRDIPT